MKVLIAIVWLTTALASVPRAHAQGDEDEARQLFEDARAAHEARRYPEAVRLLERSLEIAPQPATALNLARSLRSMGRVRAALDVVAALRESEYGELSGQFSQAVETLDHELSAEIATLEVSLRGPAVAELRIDGELVGDVERGTTWRQRLDPGDHIVLVSTSDGRRSEREVTIEPGGTEHLAVQLPEEPLIPDEVDDGMPVWPWILGGIALAAGAAVLTIILVTSGDSLPDQIVAEVRALSF